METHRSIRPLDPDMQMALAFLTRMRTELQHFPIARQPVRTFTCPCMRLRRV